MNPLPKVRSSIVAVKFSTCKFVHDLCCETVLRVLWPERVNVTENQINKSLMKSPFPSDLFPDFSTVSVRWEIQEQACFVAFRVFVIVLEVSQFVIVFSVAICGCNFLDARLKWRHYF